MGRFVPDTEPSKVTGYGWCYELFLERVSRRFVELQDRDCKIGQFRSLERISSHSGRVSYPVLLDRRTLMYLASDSDGSGPWLYSMDVARRIAHRLTSGLDQYTSLASSADGRRLVVTLANPKRTLWRLRIADSSAADAPAAQRISLTTSTGFSPRLGPDYLLYVSGTGTSESIWKFANGTGT
jgi:hypothetical protein